MYRLYFLSYFFVLLTPVCHQYIIVACFVLGIAVDLLQVPGLSPEWTAERAARCPAQSGTVLFIYFFYYRKCGSASYIVREILSVREREIQREKDGSDVTIVALKLAMNSHFPLPKIRTFRFSLHTSRLSLHGEVTIVALKFAMSSHFPLPKFFSPSLFPLYQMARAARRVIDNPRQMIKSCPVLFCSSHRKNESN